MPITRVLAETIRTLFGFWLVIIFCSSVNTVNAETVARYADVRILIDVSGSMKNTDPDNLRKPAYELMTKLLPETSRAGVWSFAENTLSIISYSKVSPAWRSNALKRVNRITSDGMYTNIPLALMEATTVTDSRAENVDRHVILLTDGMIDVSQDTTQNDRATQELHNRILPLLKERGFKVHTIALSQQADRLLLEKIAIATGGLSEIAESAEDLAKIFVQALDTIVPSQQVSLKNNQFVIDSSVNEFTLLVFRERAEDNTVLTAADGKRYQSDTRTDNVVWHRGIGYDLITVKKPMAGQWKIESSIQAGSRVTVLSNINLQTNRFPNSYFIGEKNLLTASLYENDKPIDQSEFLKLVDMKVNVTRRENNQFWSESLRYQSAQNNKSLSDFSAPLTMLDRAGTYDIIVKAHGKTFERETHQTIAVYDTFDVVVDIGEDIPPVHKVTLIARYPEIDLTQTKVVAHITEPDGNQLTKESSTQDDGIWAFSLSHPMSGEFHIGFEIETKDKQGTFKTYKTEPRTIIHLVPGEVSRVEAIADTSVKEIQKNEEVEPNKAENNTQNTLMYVDSALGVLVLSILGYVGYRKIKPSENKASKEESIDKQIDSNPQEVSQVETKVNLEDDLSPQMPVPDVLDDSLPIDVDGPVAIAIDEFDSTIPNAGVPESVSNDQAAEEKTTLFSLPDEAIDIDPEADQKK